MANYIHIMLAHAHTHMAPVAPGKARTGMAITNECSQPVPGPWAVLIPKEDKGPAKAVEQKALDGACSAFSIMGE